MKEFCLVMKGFEDSSLGHVFSKWLVLLFFYFFFLLRRWTLHICFVWYFWYYPLGWASYVFTGACQSFRTENPTLQRKNHDDNKTRESTVSFAILSQNFLTLVNWEIFQISPATVNRAINKAKGKIKNYNKNLRGGEGIAFLLFFLPPLPRLVCTTFDGSKSIDL